MLYPPRLQFAVNAPRCVKKKGDRSSFQQSNFGTRLSGSCVPDDGAPPRSSTWMLSSRFMEMRTIIGMCVLLALPSFAHSQAKQLVDIAVTCKESVGNSFVFQFKEAIRSSASYTLTPTDSASKATLFVDIVCVDVSPDTSEPGTAVSVIAYTFRRNRNKGTNFSYLTTALLYHGVRYMTYRFTKESAIGMLAEIDEQNSKQVYDLPLHQGINHRDVGGH